MCGIVGYTGKKNIVEILFSGLSKLEYRGYDSAGIALNTINEMKVFKASGKLQNLKDVMAKQEIVGVQAGIGHTRWATHGIPNEINAHPHSCNCGNVAVIHNGIIENFKELKEFLITEGCVFKSQTDTEVIAHLVAYEYGKDNSSLKSAVSRALKRLSGAYALCIMHNDYPDMIVVARKNAPLLIGLGDKEHFIASDATALVEYTKNVVYLKDDEIGVVTPNELVITDLLNNPVVKKVEMLSFEAESFSKQGYKHYMLKEIHEQPDVIRNILFDKFRDIAAPVVLKDVKLDVDSLKKLKRIEIIACGTSLHAALVGKYLIEELAEIPVDVEASSEYIYRKTITSKDDLVIGVSQSGETADTLTAVRQAKEKGAHVLIMTNRLDSAMARLADSLIPINAGIEVSVAATKSYIAQLLSFYLLAIYLAEVKGVASSETLMKIKQELLLLPQKTEQILLKENQQGIINCAKAFANYRNFIYIARGINLANAFEGALKLKEISYINATGYSAGELKHGPIAMLDEFMPVLAILMPGVVYEKILSNVQEAKARNARLIAVTSIDNPEANDLFEHVIKIPEVSEVVSPLLSIIVLQLLAYYIAEFLGKDVDQPRNLAKSVTVE